MSAKTKPGEYLVKASNLTLIEKLKYLRKKKALTIFKTLRREHGFGGFLVSYFTVIKLRN